MEAILFLLCFIFSWIFWFYFKNFKNYQNQLRSQGISFEKPLPIFGNLLPIILQKEGINQFLKRFYSRDCNEKIVACFELMQKPTLIIKDINLIKKITITDFDSFQNHNDHVEDSKDDFLGKTMFTLQGAEWKDIRSIFSPLFTSSKLKFMYGLLVECQEDFLKLLLNKAKTNGGKIEIDTYDTFARLTADGISTTTLGMKNDCVANKNSKLFKIAKSMSEDVSGLSTTIYFMMPKVFKFFKVKIFRKSTEDFFKIFVTNEIKRRDRENHSRPDAIQLMLKIKKGELKTETGDIQELGNSESKVKLLESLTDEDLSAQAMGIFLAGFETKTSFIQAMCFELAINPDVQQTLIDEVDEMLEKLDGNKISYEQLNSLKFLELVMKESLRKWPPGRQTNRVCTKDYLLVDDETGKAYEIKKGTNIYIPIHEIHRDAKYYTNPDKFDPYRFSGENNNTGFLPFGIGPRRCVGDRFAVLEAKLIWFYILSNFFIEPIESTPKELEVPVKFTGFDQKISVALKIRNSCHDLFRNKKDG